MYCPEKLKLNKFKEVAIPRNKTLFMQRGEVNVPSSQYTGDETPVDNLNKTESLEKTRVLIERDIERYAKNKNGED